jgi:glycosyltransferase involved in cell wall biosynthesis
VTASQPLSVSVVICTRNRPRDLSRCLESLQRLDEPPLEVLIVDQSDTPSDINGDLFQLHPMTERGISRSRNRGISLSRGDVIAFLDDDCTVSPGWLRSIRAAFERHPDADCVFGQVLRVTEDADEYVPEHIVKHERRLHGRFSVASARGLTAAMFVRASAALRVGPFDMQLGHGGHFRSSEDWDWIVRALAAGLTLVETPDIAVRHYGGRRFSTGDAARLLRLNAYSHGAFHAKLLRCGEPAALVLLLDELWTDLRILRPLNLLRNKPTNGARIVEYVKGLIAGTNHPIDRAGRIYV